MRYNKSQRSLVANSQVSSRSAIKLPQIDFILRKKHSAASKHDIALPLVSERLQYRLRILKGDNNEVQKVQTKEQEYTSKQIRGFIRQFLSLRQQFLKIPKTHRKQFYRSLPGLLYSPLIINLIDESNSEKIFNKLMQDPRNCRDFIIMKDFLEKIVIEKRRKELISRQKRLQGYNIVPREGLQHIVQSFEKNIGKMQNVKNFNRDFSKLISKAVFNIKSHQMNKQQ